MNEKIQKFYEVVSTDEALQAELTTVTEGVAVDGVSERQARQAMAEAVAAFAAEHDLDLTVEDVLAADVDATAEGELSEAELEAVAGGSCGCVIIGAVKGCACFFFGQSKDLSTSQTQSGKCISIGGTGKLGSL